MRSGCRPSRSGRHSRSRARSGPVHLQPPAADEKSRHGEGGVDCHACRKTADDLIWEDARWQLTAVGPTGLPLVLILEPKEHYDIETLPAELAGELGPLMQRIERAVRAAGDIGRVHIGRWGEGSEHLHWWFMGRPARMRQLSDSFAAVWDDVLPPVPEDDLACERRGSGRGAPRMTYSIIARDPETGELGVAVQSRAFNTGAVVPWGAPGVGVVATQSYTELSYGPLGLELLRAGKTPEEALTELVAADDDSAYRQVAMLDAEGRVAVHVGEACIPAAGFVAGDGFSAQANMVENERVWESMAESFERSEGPLADRLLDALDAAEAAGGDWRGRQAGGILVVAAEGEPWAARVRSAGRRPPRSARRAASVGSDAPCLSRYARSTRRPIGRRSRGRPRARPAAGRGSSAPPRPASSRGAGAAPAAAGGRAALGGLHPHTGRPQDLLPNAAELLED